MTFEGLHHIPKPLCALAFFLYMPLFVLPILSASASESYQRYMNFPSEQLYELGTTFDKSSAADSAMVCFSILANRYDKRIPDAEKLLCSKAYASMSYILFFHYFDYPKAMENSVRSLEIMEDTGAELPNLYLIFGLMYCSIGESAQDRKTTLMAIDYMRKAFHSAYRQGDGMTMNTAFGNMVSQAYKLGQLDSITTEWHIFRDYKANNSSPEYTQFNRLLYEGITLIRSGHYDEALEKFDRQITIMPVDQSHVRYIAGAWEYKAMVHAMRNNWQAAIDCSHRLEQLVIQFDIKDARVEVYRLLANYYDEAGKKDESKNYMARYFSLKDTLLNYRQVASLDEMKYLREMRVLDRRMEEMRRSRRNMRTISIAVFAVAIATLIFMYVVYRKNRRLRRANELLYRKNVEVLKAEENERQQRYDYERQLSELRSRMELDTAVEQKPQADGSKYKGSNLNEEDKNRLMAQILSVMDNTSEICSADFSAERLAALVGSKYKYVSQVINEKYNSNFNTFLNDFRIKEACRRISDIATYGNLTIEAISTGVGFRSRSTFVTQFKRVTGMTPSEYQSIARN